MHRRPRRLHLPLLRPAEDRHTAVNWIIRNQLGRRNVTEQQKAYLRGKWYQEIKGPQGGDHCSEKANGQSVRLLDAAAKVSAETSTPERTVRRDSDYAQAVDALGEKSPALRRASSMMRVSLAGPTPRARDER
jgi:hypothetical protein